MRRKLALIVFLVASMLPGCAPKARSMADAQANRESWMAVLKAAKFKGHVRMEQGGSPLSIGQKTVFFAGPENMSFEADGSIDFSGPNSTEPQ